VIMVIFLNLIFKCLIWHFSFDSVGSYISILQNNNNNNL
jgi:hypothetical protein